MLAFIKILQLAIFVHVQLLLINLIPSIIQKASSHTEKVYFVEQFPFNSRRRRRRKGSRRNVNGAGEKKEVVEGGAVVGKRVQKEIRAE